MPDRQRGALYVPTDVELDLCLTGLAEVTAAEDLDVISLVRQWTDLADLVCDRAIEVGVVWSRDHLPPDRVPRLVIADEYPPIPGQRRPRWR